MDALLSCCAQAPRSCFSRTLSSQEYAGGLEWQHLHERLVQHPWAFFKQFSWEEKEGFLQGVSNAHNDHSNAFHRACQHCPILAYLMLKAGADADAPDPITGHSAFYNYTFGDRYSIELQRLLLSQGCRLRAKDVQDEPAKLKLLAQRICHASSRSNATRILEALTPAQWQPLLKEICGQMAKKFSLPGSVLRENRLNLDASQAAYSLKLLRNWFYADTQRVRALLAHYSTADKARILIDNPEAFFHLEQHQQQCVIDHLSRCNRRQLCRYLETYGSWYVNHHTRAEELLYQLSPRQCLRVLAATPQLWQHVHADQKHDIVREIKDCDLSGDLLVAFGRNPLTWDKVFPFLGPAQRSEALTAPGSPFARLQQLDPDAFEQFEFFLQQADLPENQEKIQAFFSLGPELWKLFIDHAYHHFGPEAFDNGVHGGPSEWGYLRGMEAAAAWMCSLIKTGMGPEQQLNAYLIGHAIIMAHDSSIEADIEKRVRASDQTYRIPICDAEWEDFLQQRDAVLRQLDPTVLSVDFESHEIILHGEANLRKKLGLIFWGFEQRINAAEGERASMLRAIAWKFQSLERLHIYTEGHARSNIVELQKDLVSYDFPPALLRNLREDAYLCTLDAMVEKIRIGIERHMELTDAKKPE